MAAAKTPVFLKRKRPGQNVIAKKLEFHKVNPSKFKFHIPKKQVLYAGEVGLKNGGKVKIEALRNINDGAIILPVNAAAEEQKGNWTCNVQQWSGDVYNKETVMLNPNFNRIYPGAIFPFETIANGNYKEVPYKRKPVVIGTDNVHFKNAKAIVTNPSFVNYMEKLLQLKQGATPGGGRQVGTSSEMWSEEDFFLQTGGSGYYLTFGGSFNLNFKNEKKSFKYFTEVYQAYYTILVDTSMNEPTDFFYTKAELPNDKDAIGEAFIDPNWVYVDSVTYGRILYVIYEADRSFSSLGIDANVYGSVGFAGGEANMSAQQKQLLKNTNVTVATVGGNNIYSGLLSNASSFKDLQKRIDDYFKQTNDETIISYSLRTLDQSTVGGRMVTQFTSRHCALRASKYKITWNMIMCEVNDDAGSAEEIKAFARIRAIAGGGKDILDDNKINKPIIEWEKLNSNIIPKPWTFTEGSENNPLELKEGGHWEPGKSIVFSVPLSDANAKLAIRADVVEFDDFNNDQFEDQVWEKKITELSDMEKVILTCRHEASRIKFIFSIEPIYEP